MSRSSTVGIPSVRVPRPYAFSHGVVIMELLTDARHADVKRKHNANRNDLKGKRGILGDDSSSSDGTTNSSGNSTNSSENQTNSSDDQIFHDAMSADVSGPGSAS